MVGFQPGRLTMGENVVCVLTVTVVIIAALWLMQVLLSEQLVGVYKVLEQAQEREGGFTEIALLPARFGEAPLAAFVMPVESAAAAELEDA